MKLFEYQAKKLFADYDIPVPRGTVVPGAGQAGDAVDAIGLPLVVKAQVLAGGRGKAGGIRTAASREEALDAVVSLLGGTLKGFPIDRLLLEEAVEFTRELYCSISVDRAAKGLVAVLSARGGVDIEEVAAAEPEKLARLPLDIDAGFTESQLSESADLLELKEVPAGRALVTLLKNLHRLFVEKDCSLAEINPLFVAGDSALVAGDAKLIIDDNALFRHPEFKAFADQDAADPMETEAKKKGLSYVKMDGRIGCIVNGAGLAMATMDVIKFYGGEPANFLDVGGASKAEQVREALRIVASSGEIDVILINIFGGIVRCDQVARGILEATSEMDLSIPLVVRLEGTNSREAREILEGRELIMEPSMPLAAKRAVALSGGKGR